MDFGWAKETLEEFVAAIDHWLGTEDDSDEESSAFDDISRREPLIQEVLKRLTAPPLQLPLVHDNGTAHDARNAAIAAIGWTEVHLASKQLGEHGPQLAASRFHPWVWDAAKTFLNSNHNAQAVLHAWMSINAHIQDRVGRRDVADDMLVNEVLSPADPPTGRAKLRVRGDQSSPSRLSRQRGMHHLGQAAVAGLRNVLAHEKTELPLSGALQQLAMLSVLATWIDEAELTIGQ